MNVRNSRFSNWQWKHFQMAINIAGANRFSSGVAGWIASSSAFWAMRRGFVGLKVDKSCEVQRFTQNLSLQDTQLAMETFSNGHKYSWCEPIKLWSSGMDSQ